MASSSTSTTKTKTTHLTYKKVGVDIKKIKKSQIEIGKMIKTTHNIQSLVKTHHGFGHYAGIITLPKNINSHHPISIATHTDGVGTKTMIATQLKKYDTIGIDCIAMNVNDIICVGATPIAFVDYIAANQNNQKIFKQILKGLITGAKQSKTPIVGGETAIMPDLISGKTFSFDLAGMVTGYIEPNTQKKQILGNKIKPGDTIIGAYSTGIHSNGYTLARKALKKFDMHDNIKGIGRLGQALLKPTQIYTQPILQIIKQCNIHGLAHITGGAYTKLPRLKSTVGYQITNLPKAPPIIDLIAQQGIPPKEMYKTFNMGVGFCVIAPKDQTDTIQNIFNKHKIKSQPIGNITSTKRGVTVNAQKIA